MSAGWDGGGLIGQLAVMRGLVTPEALRACLEVHGRDGNRDRLGDLLVTQGLISEQALHGLLAEQAAIQAKQREAGPVAGQPADPAAAQEALRVVQGSTLQGPPSSETALGRVNVARKSPAEVVAEQAQARATAAARVKALDGKAVARKAASGLPKPTRPVAGQGIDLDLSEDVPFEIETTEGGRRVASTAPGAASDFGMEAETELDPGGEPPLAKGVPVSGSAAAKAAPAAPAPAPVADSSIPHDAMSTAGGKMLAELVVAAARATASDLHLHTGYPLLIRQNGRLVSSNGPALRRDQLEPALLDLLAPRERAHWNENGTVETTFSVPGIARCRVQVVQGVDGPSAVFRLLPNTVPSITALGLPGTIARFVTAAQGLVIVTGPAGSGKTWTLAALVDILNTERREHIVCIERPIEFVHAPKRAVVSQREVPTHAASVARAVRAALQEDPDVVVVGEIEDAETLRLAIIAAEGGRLVLATVAAATAVRAVARLIAAFPAEQQGQAAAMLSGVLRGVVGQRLVPTADGVRRVAVSEIIDVTPAIAEKIHSGTPNDIVPTVPFDESLAAAVRLGLVTREEARRNADRPEPFA